MIIGVVNLIAGGGQIVITGWDSRERKRRLERAESEVVSERQGLLGSRVQNL